MPDPIYIGRGVVVPGNAIEVHAVRASGPGGQNVNKVASKIEMRVDLAQIQGMDPDSRRRLLEIVGKRVNDEGRLVVTSQLTRDQHRNLEDAREKVRRWIAQALVPARRRVPTRQTPTSHARRLDAKRRRSQMKRMREHPQADD